MKIKYLHIVSFLFASSVAALAQNTHLNPTVQVTNTYEGRLREIEKNTEKTFVPDSLFKFDLNFDYEGFENPYKGNSEFNPFYTDLEMAARPFDGKKVYLKAGAGYNFAPVLDFAYTFKDRGVFKMGMHANGKAFWGNHNLIVNDSDLLLPQKGMKWSGYNASARAGLDARADFSDWSLQGSVDYEGAFGKGEPCGIQSNHTYNGVMARIGGRTNFGSDRIWRLAADLSYAFGRESVHLAGNDMEDALENNASLKLTGAYVFDSNSAIELDLKGRFGLNYPKQKVEDVVSWGVIVNPRYVYSYGDLSLGVGAGFLVDGGSDNLCKSKSPVGVWPTIDLQWNAVDDRMDLYVNADMTSGFYGAREDALENNFYICMPQMANTRQFDINAGMKGNLWQQLDYDLGIGYDRGRNTPLFLVSNPSGLLYHSELSIMYANLDDLYARASLKGRFGAFSFDASAKYRHYLGSAQLSLYPPKLTASLDMRYSIRKRIGLEAGVDFRSSYHAGYYKTPYLIDLHAQLDYRATNHLTLFLSGSNLLNRSLQYIPLFARKGVCVTAGVVLNL